MLIRKILPVFLINTFLGLVLYSYLFYSEIGEFPVFLGDIFLLAYIIIASNLIGFALFAVNSFLNQLSIWRKKIGLRFILGIAINYIIILITTLLVVWIYLQLTQIEYTFRSLLEEYNEIEIRVYILALVLDILYVVFDFLVYSYRFYSYGQIQNAKLARKQMQLQFEALRTQLSPHYLFNSLNTISSLIYKDVNQTENYIRKLASTYQYILESDKKALISLQHEINFINDYCYLLQIRFGNIFHAEINYEEQFSQYLVPPLSIQILIENAVKHNVFDEDNPLNIYVLTDKDSVVVKNKILKEPSSRESFKIGLTNIQKRYKVFTDKKINIIKDEFFTVELPLLKPNSNG